MTQAGLLPSENNLPDDHGNENDAARDRDKDHIILRLSRVFQIILLSYDSQCLSVVMRASCSVFDYCSASAQQAMLATD
jgi:hypothetical protein